MKGTIRLHNVDKMPAEMTIQMTVGEWRQLRETLDGARWPQWPLKKLIGELVEKATAQFDSTDEISP